MAASTVRQKVTPWLVPSAVMTATVFALHQEGRLWWCTCGEPSLWAGDPQSSHCSQHLLDPYTFTHVLHGVVLCGFFAAIFPRLSSRWSLSATIVLEALWEVVEN